MYLKRLSIAEFVASADHLWADVGEQFPRVFGIRPGPSEIQSWKNSYPALARVLSKLPASAQECVIFLEFGMPSSSTRADVLIAGITQTGQRAAVVVELKQWSAATVSVSGNAIKLGVQEHLHPSEQALGYREYLEDLHRAFSDLPALVRSCCFLHESAAISCRHLLVPPFDRLVEVSPLFGADEDNRICEWLSALLANQPDSRYLAELDVDQPQISRSLSATVAKAIREEPAWTLLDEQRLAFNTIMDIAKHSDGNKHLVLVTGGPGTGKSVIAMQVLGELHRLGIPAVHVTNSKSFTTVMQSLVARRRDALWGTKAVNALFRLSHSWIRKPDKFRVAICDEAHRFRSKTTLYPYLVSDRRQAEEILENVDVLIAFVDERQRLRRGEDGTIDYFWSCAAAAGVNSQHMHGPIHLNAQFRSAGNHEFVRALDDALYEGIGHGFIHDRFECTVLPGIEDVEAVLNDRINAGFSARLVAGFCWPWSNALPSGELVPDVQLGSWTRAWNRNAGNDSYPPDRHPYAIWANRRDDQLHEVGCIYSAQGFEFDYVGVIWGKDLVWRDGKWLAQPESSFDPELNPKRGRVDAIITGMLLKNAYRVLCTRALRGCFIYCADGETRDFLRRALG